MTNAIEEFGFTEAQLEMFASVARCAGWEASRIDDDGAVFAEYTKGSYVRVDIDATPGKDGFLARRIEGDTSGRTRATDATNAKERVLGWLMDQAIKSEYDRGAADALEGVGV